VNKKLVAEAIPALICKMPVLKALDLSRNKITYIPNGFPPTLVALDLSSNLFTQITGIISKLNNLIEIKLANNSIGSMNGLSSATALQHIDLSYNKIQFIEGIEMLSDLTSLNLRNNHIQVLYYTLALYSS
jgi:Leucine-rich repeat (LRR) protein